ncbi:MAG TPA: endonuclease/exonuclease/phosphatase family protein [Woeseiaceae bacterium]|nr:endonuclease/exonuclease/phosphatase family protein [Woeseiaceae bacterium]
MHSLPRRIAALGLALLLGACVVQEPADRPSRDLAVRVLSFNIRYGTAPDGPNAWPQRAELVFDVIRRQDSDFVGLQEALRFQIDAIRDAVSGYEEVGGGRDDGREAGEYSAILYLKDRWRVADSGTLWLSDTPAVPGSMDWGNRFPRIVTWGRFVERESGRAVWVFNTHFDHESQRARLRSAELLAERIADREPRDPVIVTGDFNAGEANPAIRHLEGGDGRSPVRLVDTFRVLHPDAGAAGTFGEFTGRRNGPKIDYVFVERGTRVLEAQIIRDNRDGRYPSDHYPVFAEIVPWDAPYPALRR